MSGVLFVTEIHRQRTEHGRPLREAVLVGPPINSARS